MLCPDFTNEEILKFVLDNGIIDATRVQAIMEMNKRQEYLSKHEHDIWQGKNGSWYTYIPDKEKGRILKKRKSKQDIENFIVDFYQELEDFKTFRTCFESMVLARKDVVSPNTYTRYDEDFKRFFENTEIENRRIESFDSEMLDIFIRKRIKELNLRKKAMKAMYGYIKATFLHSAIKKYIKENPAILINSANYYTQFCYTPLVDNSKRIVSKEQAKMLLEQFKKDYVLKPNYIPTYAVEFAMLTGMRVGEIAALRWDAISDQFIVIDKEEIYTRETGVYSIADYTKNRRPRIVPMTDEISELLNRIETVEKANGYYGEYVFMNGKGKLNKNTITNCSRYKSFQCGIDAKPIHAHRRTLNSAMRCGGVSATVASAIIGNTEEVNSNFYTYDMTDIAEKRIILEQAQKVVHG